MKFQSLALTAAMTAALVACGGGSNNNTDNNNSEGIVDNSIPAPTTYTFDTQFAGFDEGTSAVKYTGQTARHMLIEALVTQTLSYENAQPSKPEIEIIRELEYYFDGSEGVDSETITFSREGVTFTPDNGSGVTTFASISSGKNIVDKIAGNDTGVDAGALEDGLVNGEFFGWDDGTFTATGADGQRPEDFVRHLFGLLAAEVVDSQITSIPTAAGSVDLNVKYVDGNGRDFRQLIQKFLLGAVTFSQGTSDYLQTDFSADNAQDGTSPYTSGAHDWDEAFGYFGAARNFNDYTDDEISAKGGRDGWSSGYYDTNGDGKIDLTSEINLGNSSNCAKRDRGTVGNPNPTNFTKTVFDAFIAGRTILNNAEKAAAEAGGQVDLTAAQAAALEAAGNTAAATWEKCVAATVVHYINDTSSDVTNIENGQYKNLEHYTDLAKHWAEMMGFALGLQFNVESPIYASAENLAAYKAALTAMGTAPVLADDGEQAIADYLTGLAAARDSFEAIYSFDKDNVANW